VITVADRYEVDRARQLTAALVGRRTGLIRDIAVADPIDGDAPLHYAGATVAQPHRAVTHMPAHAAGGCGVTREQAIIAALCEGFERYAAAACPPSHAPLQSRQSMTTPSIDPAALAMFNDEQRALPGFPFARVDDATPLRWVRGTRLTDGEPIAAPAFAVYLPYLPTEGEPLVAPSLSTGLACADSLAAAVRAACCEVIERDAVALTWLRGGTPPWIADDVVRNVAGHLLPPRDQVWAFDLTTDIDVPVVLVVCIGNGPRGQIVSVGAACDPCAAVALAKAAREASQDRVYVRWLINRQPMWNPGDAFEHVTDFAAHARLYSGRPALARQAMSFLLDGPHIASTRFVDASVENDLEPWPPKALNSAAVVDLTPPYADAFGLHVVRVVAPDLMPLHGHHGLAMLGHPRLTSWRSALPHAHIHHQYDLWPYPHPMP